MRKLRGPSLLDDRECRRALEAGEPATFEAYDPTLETWFAVRVYPSPEGVAVYFQDVTEQRRATEALAESEALRQGAGGPPDFVCRYLDPAGLRPVRRTEADSGHGTSQSRNAAATSAASRSGSTGFWTNDVPRGSVPPSGRISPA